MRAPHPNAIPSESTVEQLANHNLLNLISPYGTFFFVPTKREERRLAFDASLQGQKALVIQYKRLHVASGGAFSVAIAPRQFGQLRQNFPAARNSYVFYAFSIIETYADLDGLFSCGLGFAFGVTVLFVDAHALPPNTSSLWLQGPFLTPRVLAGSTRNSSLPITSENLISTASHFLACRVGIAATELQERRQDAPGETEHGPMPHLNVLWAHAGPPIA